MCFAHIAVSVYSANKQMKKILTSKVGKTTRCVKYGAAILHKRSAFMRRSHTSYLRQQILHAQSAYALGAQPHRADSMGMTCFFRLMTPGRKRVLPWGSTPKAWAMSSASPRKMIWVPSSSTSVSIRIIMS